jgi:acyl-homoserine-lactone acylase
MELDHDRWRAMAAAVTIVRDDWGIPHIRASTDAEVVFGLIYAQAEDDFNRIETNYLKALGRMAEGFGEQEIFSDLRMKIFVDPENLKARYAACPHWLRALMDAWADGLNFYLANHPQIKPRVIQRFEPWMVLSFTEGSIGGDIEHVSVAALKAFYTDNQAMTVAADAHVGDKPTFEESAGSNGIAIAPANTREGHALLFLNPHTDFYFRSEMQLCSDAGLNVYGLVTWGQFFVYQGFNERVGWMHTTSGADVVDEYVESISQRGAELCYRHGDDERPVQQSTIAVPFRKEDGELGERRFTVFRTHHGPIVRSEGGKWISVALMYKPVESLTQSFLRMKARDYRSFLEVAQLRANSFANTIYADADGNIAYLHPQFIPRRDDRFDFSQPVDGSDPATDWQGEHSLDELPQLFNPANGWIANTNNWPYSAAGACSPKRSDYPRYMDLAGENPRGIQALRVLEGRDDFTLHSLVAATYDRYLPALAPLITELLTAWSSVSPSSAVRAELMQPIDILQRWDGCWAADSVATSLAIFWAEQFLKKLDPQPTSTGAAITRIRAAVAEASTETRLQALLDATRDLHERFGSWRTPWGEINRFQRLVPDVEPRFDDSQPSKAVPFTSGVWGSLAVFIARHREHKRRYGISGNSFVGVVEFGPRVRALAASLGGASGHPDSPHFNDQTDCCLSGRLRAVYFYADELRDHVEDTYHPGRT